MLRNIEALISTNKSLAKLLGNSASSFRTIQYGKLLCRSLEMVKIQAFRLRKGNFDKKNENIFC